MGGEDGKTPMGRLHAAQRVGGALKPEALCGVRLPAHSLRDRPFGVFTSTHPKACATCVAETQNP